MSELADRGDAPDRSPGDGAQPLRAWRAERLLSTRDLARAAGVASSTVYLIEHQRVRPHLGTIRRLAAVLDVDPLQVTEFRAAIKASSLPPRSLWPR